MEPADGKPQELKRYETNSVIVAALPASFRHRFGLIEESGRIGMYDV